MFRVLRLTAERLGPTVKSCSLVSSGDRAGQILPSFFNNTAWRNKSTSSEHNGNDGSISNSNKKVYVNVIPIWRGQGRQGVRYGPAIMHGIVQEVSPDPDNLVTKHFEDKAVNNVDGKGTEAEYTSHMNNLSREMSACLEGLKPGDTVLNLGGDHSVSMATVQTMYRLYPDLRVVWIDAHADINSPETSNSGNYHGMPVYYFSKLSDESKNSGQINVKNIKYIGVRDLDAAEVEVLEEHNIKNYTNREVITKGTDSITEELISEMELLKYPVHISFDIDSVDPTQCPSTGTRAPDGLSVSTVVELVKRIKETGNLVSMDIVEFNPLIGSENDVETTVQSIRTVVKEVLR